MEVDEEDRYGQCAVRPATLPLCYCLGTRPSEKPERWFGR